MPQNKVATGQFLGLVGNSTTEADEQFAFPTSGHITALYCGVNTAPDANHADTFTVRIGGVAQSLTCTVTQTSGKLDSKTTGASIAVAAGALVDIGFTSTSGGGGGTPTVTWALQYGP